MTRADEPGLACIDAVERMTDLLEDALPPAEARRLERHLELCGGCEEHLEQLRSVAGSLGGLAGEPLTDRARADLIAAFRASRRDP